MGGKRRLSNAEKRKAILEAAAILVAERGRGVSLADVCSRAGVSRQTIYNHHRTKDGLFEAVAAQGLAPCPCCPEEGALPLEVRLSRYAATLLAWTYSAPHATALRASCRGLDTWQAETVGARGPASRSLAAILRREALRGDGSAPDPAAAAALFLDLVLSGPQLRIVLGAQDPPSAADLDTVSRRCARLFVRGWSEPRSPHRPTLPERRPGSRPAAETLSAPAP